MKRRDSHIRKVFFTLLVAFAIVSFWRGAWGLMDIYLFPSNLVASFSISIVLGIFILYFTKNLIKRLI